jgi:hypothetical protein
MQTDATAHMRSTYWAATRLASIQHRVATSLMLMLVALPRLYGVRSPPGQTTRRIRAV